MEPSASPKITPEMMQEHPELMLASTVIMLLFSFFVSGGLASWILITLRVRAGKPLLQVEPWLPRAWGFTDMLIIVCSVVLGQSLMAYLGIYLFKMDPGQFRAENAAMPLSVALLAGLGNVAAMLLGVVWIVLRYQVPFQHAGFGFQRLRQHLVIGTVAGLATLPVIYLLMLLVSMGLSAEYSHPLIEEMSSQATLASYLIGAVTAALIAPVTEEFLFRVVIQGWLQSLPFKSLLANVFGGHVVERPALELAGGVVTASLVGGATPSLDAELPSENVPAASSEEEASSPRDEVETTAGYLPPIWPSVVTGVLFGLAHWGYGLSFIPLIVLGIVLGLVYRATHSIWPCVLIHMMLNGSSMLALGATLIIQRVTGE